MARGWEAHLLLADYDFAALQARGMLDSRLGTVVYPTEPGSYEKLENLVSEYQTRPSEVGWASRRATWQRSSGVASSSFLRPRLSGPLHCSTDLRSAISPPPP